MYYQHPHLGSYYVLRDDMLGYYVNDIAERLATMRETDGWQVNHCAVCFPKLKSDSSGIRK